MPVSASLILAVVALLLKMTVALAMPVVFGLNVNVNDTLDPAGIVTGRDRPPSVNTAESVEFAALTVTLPPFAVSMPEALALSPTTTLPMFRVEGVTVSVPMAVAPDPERFTFTGDALDEIATLPLAAPAEVGLNETFMLVDCPTLRETGRLMPLTLKPEPLAVTPEIVTLAPPVLVIVSDWV